MNCYVTKILKYTIEDKGYVKVREEAGYGVLGKASSPVSL
jgi:hypothetical protein